ncbi:hypothetical protein C8Q76DRAFT_721336 [Earliella scabrosa]|nr:hypothetical protein C8Q76DRAFT_721336 [Earliella scabrosa]
MHSSRKKKSISAADMFRSFYGVPYGFDAKAFAKSLRLRPGQGVSSVVCVEFAHCLCNKKEQLLPLINVVDEVVWDGKRLTVEDINT